ncbi:MAG: efflux RND transporter periplasmic adaptor subunit [Nevskia sp.]|nr:efflux RND transporter periplasmic adaptor subunit [Nevskia sp.]
MPHGGRAQVAGAAVRGGNRRGFAAAAGVFLALGCAAALAHEEQAQEQAVARPPQVRGMEARGSEAPGDAVFLDKPAQRRAGIRTLRATAAPELVRLPARVVADPRQDYRVAAPQDGIVEPVGASLPVAGQRVKAGQLLAWLKPALTQPDRRDMETDLAAADRDVRLGHIQISRYNIDEAQRLDIKLPTPSLEILTDYRSAQARSGELQGALHQALPLLAPRSGTILRSAAVAGRVVAAGQALFEVNAPGALAVEAEFADDDIDADAAQQALTTDGRAVAIRFLGDSYDSALRSHRALYAVADQQVPVQVNQPLLITAPREDDGKGRVLLPADAVFTRDGQSWVWLHRDTQDFTVRRVEVARSDGGQDSIAAGVQGGERVVIAGIAALNAAAGHDRADGP